MILVVNDAPAVHQALVESLEIMNYRVLAVANGREPLFLFEQHTHRIVLAISDLEMPDMNGGTLLRILRTKKPSLPLVASSGYPVGETVRCLSSLGTLHQIKRPVDLRDCPPSWPGLWPPNRTRRMRTSRLAPSSLPYRICHGNEP